MENNIRTYGKVPSGVRLEWLEKYGHYPWIERHAKDKFFEVLRRERE